MGLSCISNMYTLENVHSCFRTKLLSHSCVRLNESFTNIFDRLNKLEDTVNNAKTRQQNVMTLVDQTTNTFQEKIQNISDNIDDSFNQGIK